MRILHLVGRSHRRGAEQVALELADELDDRGHANHLRAVGLGHQGDATGLLVPLVEDSRQGPVQLARAASALRRELRARPVEVVLAHGASATLVTALASPRRGPALVTQTILGLAPRSFRGILGAAWRMTARRLDGAVALTPALGEELRRLGYRGPVWPVPNARRTDRFEGLDRESARRRLGQELRVEPEVGLIGLVGYLVEQKRPERAVEVLARVRASGVDAHLVVAGEGPLAGAVRQAAREQGVAEHVSLLGHRGDVEEVLAGLDLLILTSEDEGIPGVVVEAAMAGCPVVTYPLGGIAEVVRDQVTGVVLQSASEADMAAAVASLLGDRERCEEMTSAARRGAEAFSMRAIAPRYEALLREAVADRARCVAAQPDRHAARPGAR